ncbi:P2X purinoceptor 4-like [Diadema antillarum]|uniref:P2X purinoceptor 4-like n=1 Tax=Diadema antillarum TaxID=105358 RepID=UPI003A89ACE4
MSKMGSSTKFSALLTSMSDTFFDYDTPKMVQIKSKKVGAINRLVQMGIVLYAFGYVIIWQKGYQSIDTVEGSATSKLKGVAYTNITNSSKLRTPFPERYNRVWDVPDYVIPAQQTNGFFVMTNMVLSPMQSRGACPEDPDIDREKCQSDHDCRTDDAIITGNGIKTGRCVNTTNPEDAQPTTVCEVRAWCPVEVDIQPLSKAAILEEAENFTVLIKNSITFPKFRFEKRNILDTADKMYLRSCRYNRKTDPLCPIFRLGTILEEAGQTFSQMAIKGGVITIDIQWNCNLDLSYSLCLPNYRFVRADEQNAKIAGGFNFRLNGTEYRDLTKAYGILFQVKITGVAGKFDIVPLMLNFASGVALLSLATVMCDVVVLYFLKKRKYYKEAKFQNVASNENGAQKTYELVPCKPAGDTKGPSPTSRLATR